MDEVVSLAVADFHLPILGGMEEISPQGGQELGGGWEALLEGQRL